MDFAGRLDAVLAELLPDLRGRITPVDPEASGIRLAELGSQPAAARAIDAFAGQFPGGDRRAVGSLLVQWYAATTWPALAAGIVVLGRLPYADRCLVRLDHRATPVGLMVDGAGKAVEVESGLERLALEHGRDFFDAVAAATCVSPRVPWSNAVNILGWTLQALARQWTTPALVRARAFLERRRLDDGNINPLWVRQQVPWDDGGRPDRRTCCLRYRLDGIDYCSDCPLTTRKDRRRRILTAAAAGT